MQKKTIFLVVSFFVMMQPLMAQEKSGAYTFPVRPGTEQWRNLKTVKEMVQICQIPAETLKTLSSMALVEACISYPLRVNVFAYNNLKNGFERTYSQFNGYQELVNRPDFAEALIHYYKNVDIAKVNTMDHSADKGIFAMKMIVTEFFFGTPEFARAAPRINHKELMAVFIDKLNQKNKLKDIYGTFGAMSSAYAMANTMDSDGMGKISKSEELSAFKNQLLFSDVNKVLNQIISMAKMNIQ